MKYCQSIFKPFLLVDDRDSGYGQSLVALKRRICCDLVDIGGGGIVTVLLELHFSPSMQQYVILLL